jgi:transcriptional regulator with XRE-family HTH domain
MLPFPVVFRMNGIGRSTDDDTAVSIFALRYKCNSSKAGWQGVFPHNTLLYDMTSAEIQELLSYNIKRVRTALHVSQMDLAGRADISAGHMNDIERSRRWVGPDTLSRIANALNVAPYELFLPKSPGSHLSSFELLARLQNDLKGTLVKEIDDTFSGYFKEKQD